MSTPETTTVYGRLAPGAAIGRGSFVDITDAPIVEGPTFVEGGLLMITFAGVLSETEHAAVCLRLASTGPADEAGRAALLRRSADLAAGDPDSATVALLRDLVEFLLRPCLEPDQPDDPEVDMDTAAPDEDGAES